ncbi:hypothetical protein DL546_000987 [Coniochaeta pulveracea]|uniref:Uncharacterized protein n=1 Tax=Coniochaeta pulveracea TaxID=177199 RepID=A0A420Y8P7_9PEZI|nr:hypothetical protein DL546_000987 [Coniochaeta pulveracea]
MPLAAAFLWTLFTISTQISWATGIHGLGHHGNDTGYMDLDRLYRRDVCSDQYGSDSAVSQCVPSSTICCVKKGQLFPSCEQHMDKGWCCLGDGQDDECYVDQPSVCGDKFAVTCTNKLESGTSKACCPRLTACVPGYTFSDSFVRCQMLYPDLQLAAAAFQSTVSSSSRTSTVTTTFTVAPSVTVLSSTRSTSTTSTPTASPTPQSSSSSSAPSSQTASTATTTAIETVQPSQTASPSKGPTITITITISIVVTLVVVIPLPFLFLFLLRRRKAQMKEKTISPASSRPETPDHEKWSANEPYTGTQELPTAPPQRPVETDGTVLYPPVEVPGSEIPPEGPQEVVGSDPARRPMEMLGSDPSTRPVEMMGSSRHAVEVLASDRHPVEMMGSTTRAVKVMGSDPDSWNPVNVAKALEELVGYPQAWSPVEVMGSTHQPVELPERYSSSWI